MLPRSPASIRRSRWALFSRTVSSFPLSESAHMEFNHTHPLQTSLSLGNNTLCHTHSELSSQSNRATSYGHPLDVEAQKGLTWSSQMDYASSRQDTAWEILSLEMALDTLDNMAGLPCVEKFILILQKCSTAKDLATAKRLYAHACNHGLEAHRGVGNTIVPMFVECGSVLDSQVVFNRLLHRNVHSWTSLISGYVQCGQSHNALNLYQNMQHNRACPNRYTYISLIKACTQLTDVVRGRQLHMEIKQMGLDTDLFIGSTLVDMYSKCGCLSEASTLFSNLPTRNIVTWTALISGYAEHGPAQEALNLFENMQLEGISPNAMTFVCILKACGNIGSISKGRELHTQIIDKGFERNPFVSSTLVNMYAKCGLLSEAQRLFDKLQVKNVVSWNILISGYSEHGHAQEALECFERMQLQGVSPNAATFVCVLKTCSSTGAINMGREMHTMITNNGFDRDPLIGSTLVDMYAKFGLLSESRKVFDLLSVQDVVSWSALIAGYAEHGPAQEALKCFEQMQLKGVSPDAFTFACILKGCGSIGAIEKGREIQADAIRRGFGKDLFIGNSLVDMYVRCGSIKEAREVFDNMPARDIVSWITMINGYGMNNESNMAMQLFAAMQKQGLKPNAVAFTCLLTACSHTRLLLEGQEYFKSMKEDYGIIPAMKHYNCMVDLLSRSGRLCEAEKFLESMPFSPSTETWKVLLSACKTYGKIDIGLRCFQKLVERDRENAAPYVLMANILSNSGRIDNACKIDELRKLAGAKKKVARALIEVNKQVYEFVVGSKQNPEILAMLEVLRLCMKEAGHSPNLDLVLRPITDKEKESTLCEHAEKLALAFGLLNTAQGQTLRITKNMRMCNNCHNANKVISKIERREIIVRDSYCIHHFKDGVCSCPLVL